MAKPTTREVERTPRFAGLRPASSSATAAARGASKKRDTRCELMLRLARRVRVGGSVWCSGKCYALDLAVLETRLAEQAREQLAQEPGSCNACDAPLLPSNVLVDDGCPCNSPRGVNFAPQPCAICGIDHCVRPGHRTNPMLVPMSSRE